MKTIAITKYSSQPGYNRSHASKDFQNKKHLQRAFVIFVFNLLKEEVS